MRMSLCGLLILASSAAIGAMFMPVDVENVPVARVTANLERQLAEQPKNLELLINLARVHAMAFATKSDTVPSARVRGGKTESVPWLGHEAPRHQQFTVETTSDPKRQAEARGHLTSAIQRYREARVLAPDNMVATLGLGWALIQAGDRAGAMAALREVTRGMGKGRESNQVIFMATRSLFEEAAFYLIPLLDPEKDRDELAALRARVDELQRRPRAVTPIAVPLQSGLNAFDIVNENAAVTFDADGSGIPTRWTWIEPTAAWLVFDRRGTGRVDSALQLFGSVTFWLFWQNGYHALRTLDDDGDNEIRGSELTGLALWHDRNRDGTADRGEVRPVTEWNILALSCQYAHDPSHPDEIAFSRRGVTFRDGTIRPTFDVILRTRH